MHSVNNSRPGRTVAKSLTKPTHSRGKMAAKPGAQFGSDRCGDTVAKALQIQPSQRDLREIANGCGVNWKSLLTFVGLKLTEIQECEDKERNLPDACFRGLVFWLDENADRPVSWNTLLKAMEMARMKSDARKWRDSIEGRAASLDKPGDAEQPVSGNHDDETPTPAQEEPRSNVPKLATTKAFPSHSGRPKQMKTLGDDPHIKKFKLYLMDGYKNLTPSESPVRVEYVQPSLLKVQQHKRNEDEKARLKKGDHHGNKVDFLKKIKSGGSKSGKDEDFIDVADLLKPTSDLDNRMKVVYGQAGIGKTTMLTHICRSLALDKPIQSSYALVLYFPLRDKAVSSAKTLSDLLSYYATADLDLDLSALRRAIVSCGSKEVLFIFDGADDVQNLLSSEERGVFRDLLEGRTLPQADVIVSSRTGGLPQQIMQKMPIFYEIQGLDSLSVEEYIKKFFKSSPEKGEHLWKELQSRDDLIGAAHIPMNLLIMILCLIDPSQGDLPQTLTALYKQCIFQVYHRDSPVSEKKWTMSCFQVNRCPEDVEQLFQSLSSLAYKGFMSTPPTFLFEEEHVEEAFNTTSFDKSARGLLHEHPSTSAYSNNSTFAFSHTSHQAFFCAYLISQSLKKAELVKLLEKNNSPKSAIMMVFYFYAGLTGLVDEDVTSTIFYEPCLFERPFLQKALGQSICALDELKCSNDDPALLHFLRILYESQNVMLTQSVGIHLDDKSIVFDCSLTPYDTEAIAYCLSKCHSFKALNFGKIQPKDSEHVLSCISTILMPSDSVSRIQRLTLHLNRLAQPSGSLRQEELAITAVEVMDLKVEHADKSAIAAVFQATGRRKTLVLEVWDDVDSVSDSHLEIAQSSLKNNKIKELVVCSSLSLVLSVVKGLGGSASTSVEKLVLKSMRGDDGGVGQALATACTTNTTLTDIELKGVSPVPLMEVLCGREVPLGSLAILGYSLSKDPSPCTPETLETLAQNMKVKRFKRRYFTWPEKDSKRYYEAMANGLSRNKFLKKYPVTPYGSL